MTFWELLLLVIVIGYVISGIDDLIFDVVYWIESGRHDRHLPILSEEELARQPQLRGAIITGAWQEDDVIERMVLHNHELIRYRNYQFFIGTYPNDEATQAAVDRLCAQLPKVRKSVTPDPGPTNKADNLNWVMAEVVREEERTGRRFDFVVMHDPEDVLHPLELQVINWHLQHRPDVAMIQTPIYPLPVRFRDITAGTYLDEFSEIHTKDLFVREWLGGFLPSAGVATTLRREALDRLAEENENGHVFGTDSLTEDYDLGLKLRLSGLRANFVRQFVDRPRHALTEHAIRPGPADGPDQDGAGPGREIELVTTRAEFPDDFRSSVRQRTRWTLGIVFQAWQNRGWVGSIPVLWLLFHDRKGPWAYAIVLLGYIFAVIVIGHGILRELFFPEWFPLLPSTALVGWSVTIGVTLLAQRMLQRAIATSRIFGLRHGLLAPIRMPWQNVINLAASFRAMKQFAAAVRRGAALAWDKTQHVVPILAKGVRRRLGEVLVGMGQLSEEEIDRAVAAQQKEGKRLGQLLLEWGWIDESDLMAALRQQGRRLGEILLELGRITQAQLDEAVAVQRTDSRRLGEILLDRGWVAEEDLHAALAEQGITGSALVAGAKRRLGDVLVARGKVTEAQIEAAAAEQKESGDRLGEIAVARGWVTEAELREALHEQSGRMGEVLVKMGRLTQAQLDKATAAQKEEGKRLGELLLGWGWINEGDLIAALDRQGKLDTTAEELTRAKRRLGNVLMYWGKVTEEQVARALMAQREENRPLGEIMVDRGWIRRHELKAALAAQDGMFDAA